MGVRVAPDDLPDHLLIAHQHNLNRGAEAEAQYAPIAAKARMIAEPVRMLGTFGGPVGAAYGETKAQQIEQAGGARQGYDPLAIGGQVAIPVVARGISKLLTRRPAVAPQIAPVPQPPTTKPSVYLGVERRRSPLDPAVLEENRRRSVQGGIERSERRRMSTGEAAMTPGATLSDESNLNFYGYPEAAKFFGNVERKKR